MSNRCFDQLERFAKGEATLEDIAVIRGAVSRYVSGVTKSLDDALGLAPRPGQRKPWRSSVLAARKEAICHCYAAFYARLQPTKAAHTIHADMSRLTPGMAYQDPRRGLLAAISAHGV